MDLGTRNEFKVWDETIANAQNVELLHSPDEGCGGTTEKFGYKMATTNVEKYASGTGERSIKIYAFLKIIQPFNFLCFYKDLT